MPVRRDPGGQKPHESRFAPALPQMSARRHVGRNALPDRDVDYRLKCESGALQPLGCIRLTGWKHRRMTIAALGDFLYQIAAMVDLSGIRGRADGCGKR